MNKFELLQEANRNFRIDRKSLDEHDQDPAQLAGLLLGEVHELIAEIPGGDEKKIATELADILIFTLTFFDVVGHDALDEALEKVARNLVKRPSWRYNNGMPFQEAERQSKAEWIAIGGDEDFYSDLI